MDKGFIKKLENLRWAVLEIDLRKKKNPEKDIKLLEKDIIRAGYDVKAIFESHTEKGLYHVHLKKEDFEYA